jgi:hypothetical protein
MTLLATIAFAATVVFLVLGIRSMAHGGEYDQAHGTHFMAMRVGAQGVAVLLLLLAMLALFRTE